MALILRKPFSMWNSSQNFSSLLWVQNMYSPVCLGTVILRIPRGCQRGLLQTKKKIKVPMKFRAIIWHSCKYSSSGLPCGWGKNQKLEAENKKRQKRESPNQRKRQGKEREIKKGTERKAEMVSREVQRKKETSRLNNRDTKRKRRDRIQTMKKKY